MTVLALDIGGTKLAAAVVTESGRIVRRNEVATNAERDPAGIWQRLIDLIEAVSDGQEITAIGVGCGGPMRWPDGEVSPLNIPLWRNGFPLRSRLAQRYPAALVRVHNDAVAMAVGEHWLGAGRGSSAFLGMVVSTGVGGGLVIDGRIVNGRSGNAGHVGHVVVDPDGPRCGCGGRGCLEAISRGPAIVRWALDNGWEPSTDEAPDGSSLARDAAAGDDVARAAFERAGRAIGIALASVVHVLDIDVVAVGGGLARAGELLLEPARAAFGEHCTMAYAAGCRIEPAALGPDAGLVGAAALVVPGLGYLSGGD